MAKTYSREALIAFVNRAVTWEKLDIAREFIDKLEVAHKDDILTPLSKGTINDQITAAIETVAKDVASNYK